LTTLGKVIVALTDKKASHVPYRESKLTRILSESLGGNSKTCLIVTCSPHPFNDAETLSSLRFGARARNIKNKPKVNKQYSVAELQKMLDTAEEKIEALQKRIKILSSRILELGGEIPSDKTMEMLSLQLAEQERLKKELEDQSNKIDLGNDDLIVGDITDAMLPDRRFTEMG
jgi:chromosome segregation ATPase